MAEQHEIDDTDMATDAEVATLMSALARGERAEFWGAGEVKEKGEPRLTLWQERQSFRLQGRGGVDFGAFGSIRVVFRFMARIMSETGEVED